MRLFIQKMALVALMLTLATACQKEEIASNQPDDQLTLRTLNFNLDELSAIYSALLAEVNDLIGEDVLNGPTGNGLLPQLNNLWRAIDRGDYEEANRVLEEDIIPHLSGLYADGILNQDQYEYLIEIIGGNEPDTGTVTDPAGNTYQWKRMPDGKKWLVENLRYPYAQAGYSWYHEMVVTPEDQVAYGMLYNWGGAMVGCTLLGDGWRLPNTSEWMALGEAYGDWVADNGLVTNAPAYHALIAGGSSGFNARLGGMFHPVEGFGYFGGYGEYWSNDNYPEGQTANYFFFRGSPFNEMLYWGGPNFLGLSCRCVHD